MENRQSQTTTQPILTNSDATTWELPDGAIARFGPGLIFDMAFSPDNASLAVGTRVGVWMYELDTMQTVTLFETERGMIFNIVFSPDGKWVATSNADGIINVREIETQQRVAKIQGWHGGTSRLAFSPDSRYIAASGREYGAVYVWCAKTGQHVVSFKMEGKPKEDEQPPARFPICCTISSFHLVVSFLLRVFRIQRHVSTLRCKCGILIKRPWRQLTQTTAELGRFSPIPLMAHYGSPMFMKTR